MIKFQTYRLRHFAFPLLLAILLIIAISTFLYGIIVHLNIQSIPDWLMQIIIPCILGGIAIQRVYPRLLNRFEFRLPSYFSTLPKLVLYLLMMGMSLVVIHYSAKSIRYNFGKTLYVKSVNDLQPHEQPYFLEMGDWYADRLRVIPLNTYEMTGLFTKKVQLRSLFVMPVFSRNTAYRTKAKAWLAVDYKKIVSETEFKSNQGRDFYEESLSHFRKINVREYLYLEQYPNNKFYRIYLNLVQTHSYFQSGYAYIYKGQNIHRDTLSLYYATVTSVILLLACFPVSLLISLLFQPLKEK
ncbi:hypothetical protein [Sphingobacterium wenxiniae]|uniref:Uncharacterized protein n=1 Tax=Sphingobacterium wenxiniae TaxID=683125 RepID=A0A1I6T8T6_9SPHI|nr:hypothetical protein [Sphingobacterium wenxiniae]SFS85641.1 hypothetical protein SAMN05660206_10611 [Sphingobacterium wenxiniae]